jgi:aminoglycoside phosphotransferase (APT) family kinase protein
MDTVAPLATGGNRLVWQELPEAVRSVLESAAGSPVVGAASQSGGFSPGLASVLTLADGRKVFAKAVCVSRNEFAFEAIRRETQVLSVLPGHVPAPRLRWTFDDGDWVALVTDAIDGHNPAQPWLADELDQFLGAATVLAERLTPSPIPAPLIATDDEGDFNGWGRLAGGDAGAAGLDPWTRTQLDRLAELERSWAAAAAGTSLLHGDFRSDNVLLTADGFVVVDWPSVRIGAGWLDLFLALPSVAMHGGGDPQELWLAHPLSRETDEDAVNVVLAATAGLFVFRSLQPAPPFLSAVRGFQAAQGAAALTWLRRRMGW